jgi:hypothetical protein
MKRYLLSSLAPAMLVMALLVTGCSDTNFVEADHQTALQEEIALNRHNATGPTVAGRTIQNIEAAGNLLDLLGELGEAATFVGRIVNLTFELTEAGDLLASGRLIGFLDGQLINQVLEGINLGSILDLLAPGSVSCQILYLELAPILLDVLGLVVEIPETVIVEIRAEPGPGQLLGNLLCGLVGILDPF